MALYHVADKTIIDSGRYQGKQAICGTTWYSEVHHFYAEQDWNYHANIGRQMCPKCGLILQGRKLIPKEKVLI